MESRDKEQDVFLPFPEPLREGVILARPNRFIMDVDFGTSDEGRVTYNLLRTFTAA